MGRGNKSLPTLPAQILLLAAFMAVFHDMMAATIRAGRVVLIRSRTEK